MKITRLLFISATLMLLTSTYSQAGEVRVKVENLTPGKGKLYTSICKKQKFMNGRCDFEIIKKVNNEHETVIFNQLDHNQYAVSVFYDVNDNSELDTSIFGIPKEPTGVSNNVMGKKGPPKFEDAQITVDNNTPMEITIKVF